MDWHVNYFGYKWSKDFDCMDFVEHVFSLHYKMDLIDCDFENVAEGTQYQEGDIITLTNGREIHAGIYVKDGYLLNLRKTNIGSELTSLTEFKSIGYKIRDAYRT